jgi:organic radical activating enzyme
MVMVLPFVETMITQVCNLSCVGCTNYSDLKHSGYVTWESGKKQIQAWLERIKIEDFGIMGGEPLINPDVYKWLIGVRELLPDSQIRFTTNGELLHKNLDIVKLAHDLGNVVFKITVHRQEKIIEETIENIFNQFEWEPVTEYGINRFKTTNNLRFQINRPTQFLKTYKNNYNDMLPYDSVPDKSFALCVQQKCPLLYNGRIYKCSTAGLLKDTLDRFDQPNQDRWEKYIDLGISPVDSELKIQEFINNFGKPEKICGQCPDDKSLYIDHYQLVTVK